MHQKMIKTIFILNIVQTVIYLFGFFNRVAEQSGLVPLVYVTRLWGNFYGIIFWSILSMICVIGFTLSLYLLLSKAVDSKKTVGLIISAIGYGSPLLFSFFLIIPAILLILGLIFIKWMIIDPEKSVEEYDEWHDTHA
ncbi:hypothetical protein IGJ48_000661 [Enterococcus pernyi]